MKSMKLHSKLFVVSSLCVVVSSLLISLSFVNATENGKLLKKYTFPGVTLERNQQARLLVKNVSASPLVVLVKPDGLSNVQRLRLMPGEQATLKLLDDQAAHLTPVVEVYFEDPLTAAPKSFEDPLTAKPKGFEDPLTAKPVEVQLAIYDSLNPSAQPVRYLAPNF